MREYKLQFDNAEPATFGDAESAAFGAMREILDGCRSVEVQVIRTRDDARRVIDHDTLDEGVIEAAESLRQAARRLWRRLKPHYGGDV